jgi:hypothetical protein
MNSEQCELGLRLNVSTPYNRDARLYLRTGLSLRESEI